METGRLQGKPLECSKQKVSRGQRGNAMTRSPYAELDGDAKYGTEQYARMAEMREQSRYKNFTG